MTAKISKKKRVLSVFLSVVLCLISVFGIFSTSVLAASSGSCGATGSSVRYEYNSDTKTLTITGTGAIKDFSDIQIASGKVPWSDYRGECTSVVIGEGVTRIGNRSFYNMTAMQSISLPSTLTEIGEYAFSGSTSLTDCKLPANLKEIEIYAFQNCTSLEDVVFPEGLTTIRAFAYYGSGIKSVDFPDSLTSLGKQVIIFSDTEVGSVFYNCKNLESVTFGSGLTATGRNNFSGCSSLKELDLGSSITTVSSSSFLGTFITTLVLPENVTSVETLAFSSIGTLSHVYVYNSQCAFNVIADSDPFSGSQQSVVFHGHSQSTAQTYAQKHGYEFVSIDDCAHSNMYEDITLEPTCTEEGSKNIVCSDCGAIVRTESIAALGHDFVTNLTEDKTEEDGHVYDYQTCSRCGEENTVYTHNEWVEGCYTVNYTITPTCTTGGLATKTCTVCGQKSLPEIVPAKGHNIENYTEQVLPTCTEDGRTTGKCTECGETVTVTVPALGHNETLVSTSTDEDGGHTYNIYRCETCGQERQKCVHNEWIEGSYTETVVSQATCTTMGSVEKKCTVCGKTETTNIMPTGHERDDGVVTKEPTCTETGTTTYTCIKCGNELNVPILALGHDYSVDNVLQEPTCTQSGTGQKKCSRCDSFTTYEIPALGHNITDAQDYAVVTQPTCTEPGTAAGTCANCNEYVEVEIPVTGHTFDPAATQIIKEATCEEDGTALETCSVCGARQETVIPATGHNYEYSHHYVGTVGTYLAYFCTECGDEHDELKTTVQAGFMLNFNKLSSDVNNGYLYDVNCDGHINSRDYAIIAQYHIISQ